MNCNLPSDAREDLRLLQYLGVSVQDSWKEVSAQTFTAVSWTDLNRNDIAEGDREFHDISFTSGLAKPDSVRIKFPIRGPTVR